MINIQLTISASAKDRIQSLRQKQNIPHLRLRILVEGGGCSGFQYKFSTDTDLKEDDLLFDEESQLVVIDQISLDLITGSEIHYEQDLMGSYFVIKNPQAKSSCGCGNSFSL